MASALVVVWEFYVRLGWIAGLVGGVAAVTGPGDPPCLAGLHKKLSSAQLTYCVVQIHQPSISSDNLKGACCLR